MADFNFFDQFGEKMRSLQPSERTAGEDWLALSQRMDAVLPATAQPARRRWAVPLLLLLGLVSNLWWGFTSRQQDQSLERLSAQVAESKNVPARAEKTAPCEEVNALREEVAALRNRLDEASDALAKAAFYKPYFAEKRADIFSAKEKETGGAAPGFSTKMPEVGDPAANIPPFVFSKNGRSAAALPPSLADMEKLPGGKLSPLQIPALRLPSLLSNDLLLQPAEGKKDLPLTKKIASALHPKTFRIGATAGWLYPLEADLEHQTGYAYGLQADISFSRQISFSAEWGRVALHYKALAQEAAIGLPSLPLPSPEHQFLEMDVSNQRLVFYGLGLRYKGLPQSSWHPFGSFGWSGMKVLPFEAHYETMLSGNIFKGTYSVQQRSELKNFARLGAGIEFPLGRRFDWSLEGYYLHSWRNGEPDMAGVRTGLNFIF
ncbi:MAG: hypothetical protein HY842_07475 [Bacteroidetes bacterium]|nr:hypothetical protein [Bacteroidota bacterium]